MQPCQIRFTRSLASASACSNRHLQLLQSGSYSRARRGVNIGGASHSIASSSMTAFCSLCLKLLSLGSVAASFCRKMSRLLQASWIVRATDVTVSCCPSRTATAISASEPAYHHNETAPLHKMGCCEKRQSAVNDMDSLHAWRLAILLESCTGQEDISDAFSGTPQ